MKHSRTTVIFDTETTGLIKPDAAEIGQQPYITEIYCLKVLETWEADMPVSITKIDDFEHLLKVPIKLSPEITRITGLTDEDLADKPTFGEVFRELAEFMTGVDRIVAHNLPFDSSMLANEMVRINKVIQFPWPREHICTVEKSLHIEQRRMSLTKLHQHLFDCDFPDAHRAKNDVLPLYRCYEELRARGTIL